jgi:hypothetical protein
MLLERVVKDTLVKIDSVHTFVNGDSGWDWADFQGSFRDGKTRPFTFAVLFLWTKVDGDWMCKGHCITPCWGAFARARSSRKRCLIRMMRQGLCLASNLRFHEDDKLCELSAPFRRVRRESRRTGSSERQVTPRFAHYARGALAAMCSVLTGVGLLTGAPAYAARPSPADTVHVNGRVYTVNESTPWAQAVAIRNGRFVYVGDDSHAREFVGPSTELVNLQGRFVMPGIHDAHSHLLWAGLTAKFGCKLPGGAFGQPQIAALRKCAASLRPEEWLVGGLFSPDQFPGGKPHRKYLDEAFPDRPVYLSESSLHNGLANSRALELAGINAATPNPHNGMIVRGPDGQLTGELVEAAIRMVKKQIPAPSPEQVRSVLEWAVGVANRSGITSIEEPSGDEVLLQGLQDLESRRVLTLDIAVYLMWGGQTFQSTSDSEVQTLIERRKKYQSAHVHPDGVKIWLDGAPTPPYYTEADLDPITKTARPEHLAIAPDQLNEAVRRFDAAGLQLKMHVAGAGAARVALDAIEAARKANLRSTVRHQLAHNNLIALEDMDRMKKLNATAEMSPALWQIMGATLLNPPQKAWQFKSLKARGMLMTMGTDWGLLDEPNLFPPLQGTLAHGDESIDLPFAIKMATLNGAVAVGAERDRGSIQVDKQATFIVLDRDLFAVKPADVGATKVLTTVFEGRVVYSADGGDRAQQR